MLAHTLLSVRPPANLSLGFLLQMQGFAFLSVEVHEFNVQSLPSALLKLSLDEVLPCSKTLPLLKQEVVRLFRP